MSSSQSDGSSSASSAPIIDPSSSSNVRAMTFSIGTGGGWVSFTFFDEVAFFDEVTFCFDKILVAEVVAN